MKEEKNIRVIQNEKVQIHGERDGDSFGNWWWTPSKGLPEIETGKEVVILHPCDCGCWSREKQKDAMDLLEGNDKFVMIRGDERYHVSRDQTHWFIVGLGKEEE